MDIISNNVGQLPPLSRDEISAFLQDCLLPEKLFLFDDIDSTNTEARRLISSGLTGPALLLSERQSAGRGRMGRSFYSPDKTGIYMSAVLAPRPNLYDCVSVTTAASVVVAKAVETLTGLEPQIKWVNDLYLFDKKICGILTEAVSNDADGSVSVIVGVGLNFSTELFPDDISGIAGSLPPLEITRSHLAATIARGLFALSSETPLASYIEDYKSLSMVLGKDIYYYENDVPVFARALSISDNGALCVRLADGSLATLTSGEISLRISEEQ